MTRNYLGLGVISYYRKSQRLLVSGSMNSEKYNNDILCEIKMKVYV